MPFSSASITTSPSAPCLPCDRPRRTSPIPWQTAGALRGAQTHLSRLRDRQPCCSNRATWCRSSLPIGLCGRRSTRTKRRGTKASPSFVRHGPAAGLRHRLGGRHHRPEFLHAGRAVHRHDGGLQSLTERRKHVFDDLRIDLLAAEIEHRRLPAGNDQHPVRRQRTEIAGIKPAVAEGLT